MPIATPDPDGSDPDGSDPAGPVSRRVLLGSGLAVAGVLAGGATGFAFTAPRRRRVPDPVPPADVVAAVAREQDLLARYDALLAAGANPLWQAIRAEHADHATALRALLPASSSGPSAVGSASASVPASAAAPPAPTPADAAGLVAAEQAAAAAARAACLAGNGTAAVLLACIAASESSHAAVLG